MGFSKETESKKWVIAGIAIRAPLKAISAKPREVSSEADEEAEECSTTPTSRGSRIPDRLPCPAAPRKRRPTCTSSSACHNNGVREFFNPPDLETVFIRRVERSN